MRNYVRIFFVFFIIISFSILLYYNQSLGGLAAGKAGYPLLTGDLELERAISQRITVIMYIFIMVTACIFYIVYEFYHLMYNDLADRMEMLDASRNDLQTTYDSVAMFLIEIDGDFMVTNINNAFSESIGKKKNSIIGKKLNLVLGFPANVYDMIISEIQKSFENNISRKAELENSGKIYEAFIFPLKAAKDRTKKVLLMINDVTISRAVERQMLQDNKMIAVGQLAAGIAHEIRNPLGIIRNYCYILKNSDQYDRAVFDKAITSIEKAVDKSGRIISNLLDFSRISNNKWETTNLKIFLESIISLEQNTLVTKKIKVMINCDDSIEAFTILESLEIILINLIINAVDVMPGGGSISINCTQNQNILQLQISDTGSGISEANIGNIFNPFFTTKDKTDGSGLGLYIVYNETEKLGGKVEVESQLGSGTVFTLTFPMQRSEENDSQAI
jgi:polar amino acid transport system substrate-binding protein